MGYVDVHCHLLPYVDDGAETLEIAKRMLYKQARQGVDKVILTPHWRSRMFMAPDEQIIKQFVRMKKIADGDTRLPKLYLGREYHCNRDFLKLMEESPLQTLGGGSFVLAEFSYSDEGEDILDIIDAIQNKGYRVAVAHVERYAAVQKEKDFAQCIADKGAWLQVNADSVMGKNGITQKWLCKRLLKEKLVSLVASDAHDLERRVPNLGVCAEYLRRKVGVEYTEQLLCGNPRALLQERIAPAKR